MIIGIDEAGRGPAIGPLVIAAVSASTEGIERLEDQGVKDSKDLSSTQRETLFEYITTSFDYTAVYLSAQQISQAMRAPGASLTTLEIDVIEDIIDSHQAEEHIIDAPTKQDPWADEDTIRYEHKADQQYTIVGAASIVAKHLRDQTISRLTQEIGTEMGSGYPSDPTTKAYLAQANLSQPHIRDEWKTVRDHREQRRQQTLLD